MQKKDDWSKAEILLSSAVIAAIISGFVSWKASQNEVSAKYVEMAVAVLSANKKSEDPSINNEEKALRTWAIYVINRYAKYDELKIGTDLGRALTNGDVNFNGFGVEITGKPAQISFAGAPGQITIGKSKNTSEKANESQR